MIKRLDLVRETVKQLDVRTRLKTGFVYGESGGPSIHDTNSNMQSVIRSGRSKNESISAADNQ